jgi:hypothetical protein
MVIRKLFFRIMRFCFELNALFFFCPVKYLSSFRLISWTYLLVEQNLSHLLKGFLRILQ